MTLSDKICAIFPIYVPRIIFGASGNFRIKSVVKSTVIYDFSENKEKMMYTLQTPIFLE